MICHLILNDDGSYFLLILVADRHLQPFGNSSENMKVSQKEYVYSEDGEGDAHQYEEDNRLNEMQFEINTGA